MERQKFAPGIEGWKIFVGHSGMVKCAGEVETEVVRGAEDAVGSGSGLDGKHFAEHTLLIGFGDDVIENGKDIGLLGEDFLVGVVSEEAAVSAPALRVDGGADMSGAGAVTGR